MALKVSKKLQKEYKYIPTIERESENPTIFIIKLLTKKEKAELEDNLVSIDQINQSMKIANSSFVIGAVKKGLVKVENLLDSLEIFCFLCPPSDLHPSIRSCKIDKKISLAYQVDEKVIRLLQFYHNQSSLRW